MRAGELRLTDNEVAEIETPFVGTAESDERERIECARK